MIEKLDLDYGYATVDWLPTQHGKRCGAKEIQATVNQLVDAVNGLQAQVAILQEHAHPTAKTEPTENVLTKSLRMDKEFAENECVRLQNDLERTHKALDVAVDALKDNLSQANFTQMLDASRFHCIRTRCEYALAEITALEQKE